MERILEMYFQNDIYDKEFSRMFSESYENILIDKNLVEIVRFLEEHLNSNIFNDIDSKLNEYLSLTEKVAFSIGFKYACEIKELVGGC